MARQTVQGVSESLKEHLASCNEQSKTIFSTLEELKEDLRTLHNKVDMSIYATTGFLATTLVAILLVSI
tara:strand:- start:211 stop:417 length:207 start_codon:yes stop_codon:yes gene_type:complete